MPFDFNFDDYDYFDFDRDPGVPEEFKEKEPSFFDRYMAAISAESDMYARPDPIPLPKPTAEERIPKLSAAAPDTFWQKVATSVDEFINPRPKGYMAPADIADAQIKMEARKNIVQDKDDAGKTIYRPQYKEEYMDMVDPDNAGVRKATQWTKDVGVGMHSTVEGMAGGAEWLTNGIIGGDLANQARLWGQSLSGERQDFSNQLAQGVGSMATFFIPGIGVMKGATAVAKVSPQLARWMGASTMTAVEAMTEAGSVYRDVLHETKDPIRATLAATETFTLNVPLLTITNKLGMFGESGTAIKRALMSALMEGTQEGGQEIISLTSAGKPIKWGDVATSAAIGAIIGSGTGVISHDLMPQMHSDNITDDQKIAADKAAASNQVTGNTVGSFLTKHLIENGSLADVKFALSPENAKFWTPEERAHLERHYARLQATESPTAKMDKAVDDHIQGKSTSTDLLNTFAGEFDNMGDMLPDEPLSVEARKIRYGDKQPELDLGTSSMPLFDTTNFKEAYRDGYNIPDPDRGRRQIASDKFTQGNIDTENALRKLQEPISRDAQQEVPQTAVQSSQPTFSDMVKEAARWKGAAMNKDAALGNDNKARLAHSHMTTKGDLDAYLMKKYGIDEVTARNVSNELTDKNIPADRTAKIEDFAGEPWKMNRADFIADAERTAIDEDGLALARQIREHDHKIHVKQALAKGEAVPLDVLKDYPDLVIQNGHNNIFNSSDEASTEKAPWQMTREQYFRSKLSSIPEGPQKEEYIREVIAPDKDFQWGTGEHKAAIIQALTERKAVPENVLAEYPDLVRGREPNRGMTQEEMFPVTHSKGGTGNAVPHQHKKYEGVRNFIAESISNREKQGSEEVRPVSIQEASKIKELIGIDVSDAKHEVHANDLRHMLKSHGDPKVEANRGQLAITAADLSGIPEILDTYDRIEKGSVGEDGRKSIRYVKRNNGTTTYVEVVLSGGRFLRGKTMWKTPSGEVNAALKTPPDYTSTTGTGPSVKDNITPSPKEVNTEDSGVELTYNKRNRIKKGIKWNDIEGKNAALKVRETTKQNVIPKPDYEQMVDEGMNPLIAHIVKQTYDSISAKPIVQNAPTDADLKRYIEAANRVMDGVLQWTSNPQAIAAWAQRQSRFAGAALGNRTAISDLAKTEAKTLLDFVYPDGYRNHIAELRILGGNKVLKALQPGYEAGRRAIQDIDGGWPAKQEAWQKQGWKIVSAGESAKLHHYERFDDNNQKRPIFVVEVNGRRYGKGFDSRGEADAALAQLKPFLLLDKRGTVNGQFDTEEEAKAFAREQAKQEGKSSIVSEKGIAVESAERTGLPERRLEGENITSDKLKDTFGFKGVNFGNWMKGDSNTTERQLHLNHAYDSFLDLAEILNVPPKAMSLNGMLGLAIGAQGTGAHAAHFVPGVNEINLTRTSGAGSLSHEFGHALDHYFARQAGLESSREPFLTEHVRYGKQGEGIRPEIAALFKTIVNNMNNKTITVTPEELQAQLLSMNDIAKDRVKRWLKAIRTDFERQKGVDLSSFDKLADRIINLDLGEGKISAGGSTYFSPVVAELRDIYKKASGRVYNIEQMKGLQGNLDHYAYLNSKDRAEKDHAPQTREVFTDFHKNAASLDRQKGGKPYWNTNVEKFARAFDAFISDTLEQKAAANTYLSHAGRAGETVPMGDERTTIHNAIGQLINTLKTKKEGDHVAIYEPEANYAKRATEELQGTELETAHGLSDTGLLNRSRKDVDRNAAGIRGEKKRHHTVGKMIDDLKALKAVRLRGADVRTWNEAYEALRITRNKNVEVLQVLYLGAESGKVLYNEACSSRLPGAVHIASPAILASSIHATTLTMKRISGEDVKVAIVHNHPSGDVTASEADKRMTVSVAKQLKTRKVDFEGHMIIDHNKYSVIDGDQVTIRSITDVPAEHATDPLLTVPVPHEKLGEVLDRQEHVASIAKDINRGDKYFTILMRSGSKVRGIVNVELDILKNPTQAHAYIKELMINHGAQTSFIYREQFTDEQIDTLQDLVRGNTIRDAAWEGRWGTEGVAEQGIFADDSRQFGKDIDGFQGEWFGDYVSEFQEGKTPYGDETEAIIQDAKENGTYLKAPNGEPTKLNPGQWTQVRTKAFKKWFGDWEARANAKPDRAATTFDEAIEHAAAFIGKELRNRETGMTATVSRTNLEKMTSASSSLKSSTAADHALAIANADKLFRNALLDSRHPDKKGEPTIAEIQKFVAPMINRNGKVVAVKMTVKRTTSEKQPNPLYTIQTIEIEKPALDAPQGGIERATDDSRYTPQASFNDNVRSLLESVKSENTSEVVDENGEPLVVYHGTGRGFSVFERSGDGGYHFGTAKAANARAKDIAKEGLTETQIVMPVFLNIRNQARMEDMGNGWGNHIEIMKKHGHDGIVYVNQWESPGYDSYIAFSPTQIKSATANSGAFSPDEGSILKEGDAPYGEDMDEDDRPWPKQLDVDDGDTSFDFGDNVEKAIDSSPEEHISLDFKDHLDAYISTLNGMVQQGEAGGKTADEVTGEAVWWSSTYPEFMQDKGWTKNEVLSALNHSIKGEEMTERQRAIVQAAIQQSVDMFYEDLERWNPNLSDQQFKKAEASIQTATDAFLSRYYTTQSLLKQEKEKADRQTMITKSKYQWEKEKRAVETKAWEKGAKATRAVNEPIIKKLQEDLDNTVQQRDRIRETAYRLMNEANQNKAEAKDKDEQTFREIRKLNNKIETLKTALEKARQNVKPKEPRKSIKALIRISTGINLNDELWISEYKLLTAQVRREAMAASDAFYAGNKKGLLEARARYKMLQAQQRAMREIRRETRKIIKDFKKVLKETAEMTPEYADKIKALLEDFDLTRMTGDTRLKLEAIREALITNPDADIDERTLDTLKRLEKIPIRNISYPGLKAMHDAVMHFATLGKRGPMMIMSQKKVTRDMILKQSIADMRPARDVANDLVPQDATYSTLKDAKSKLAALKNLYSIHLDTYDNLVESIAGLQSMAYRVLMREIKRGSNERDRIAYELEDDFMAAQEAFQKRHPEIKDVLGWLSENVSFAGMKISRNVALSLYRGWHDPDFSRSIIESGFGVWGLQDINHPNKVFKLSADAYGNAISKLSATEREYADLAIPTIQKSGDLLADKFLEINGYAMPRVEEGIYWRKDVMATERSQDEELEAMKERFGRPYIFKGMTKKRTGSAAAVWVKPYTVALREMHKRAADYVGLEEAMSNAAWLMYNKQFKSEFEARYGLPLWREIEKGLKDIAEITPPETKGAIEGFFQMIRNNATVFALAANYGTILKQLNGAFNYMIYVPPGYLAQALSTYISGPMSIKNLHRSMSVEYRRRREGGYSQDIGNVLQAINKQGRKPSIRQQVAQKGLTPLQQVDIFGVDIGMLAATYQALDAFKAKKMPDQMKMALDMTDAQVARLTPAEKMNLAYRWADFVTERTQSQNAPEHMSGWQRGEELEKQLAMFFGELQKNLASYARGYRAVKRGDPGAKILLLKTILLHAILGAAIDTGVDALRNRIRGRKGDKWWAAIAKSFAGYLPVIREVAGAVIDMTQDRVYAGGGDTPFERLRNAAEKPFLATKGIITANNWKKRRENAIKLLDGIANLGMMAAGIPYPAIKEPFRIWNREEELRKQRAAERR